MTDPNAKPKYAIYDEAVGALQFLEANQGVQFSGQLNGGNYIAVSFTHLTLPTNREV